MDFDEYEYLENTMDTTGRSKSREMMDMGDQSVAHPENDRLQNSKRPSGGECDEFEPSSRRSRSKKNNTDHYEDRASRRSPFSRDKEKFEGDRGRHRDTEDGGRQDRTRDRHQDRSRERDASKKRDRTGDRNQHEIEGQRFRNNPNWVPHKRWRETSRDFENADKDNQERLKEEYLNRGHQMRKKKEKNGEKVEPEADPERDQRTVFVYQIPLKAGERELYDLFSKAGKVRDVQLIIDRNTKRCRGIGYVEFYDAMSVPMAIALSGQHVLGQPVLVRASEAEKNLVQPTPGKNLGTSGEARKLYIGNLPLTIKEDDVRQVFEAFGAIELVQMPIDPGNGNCKGYAFIQFARFEDAKMAQNVDGELAIGGMTIKVSAVTELQDANSKVTDLDDDEGSGWSLKDAHSRALLMQKLDRTGIASSITGASVLPVSGQISVPVLPGLTAAALSIPSLSSGFTGTIGIPSECLLLHNMFDPNVEAEADFDLDIKEDVQEECSKFGLLKHIHVEKKSAGCVYLRFGSVEGATDAQRALHGRWFAGKMVTATFMPHSAYEAKCPDSSR